MKSPFTGIRSALLEAKNLKSNGWKMFSVCAVALIPLIYAGLFLLAFLDPYGNLSNVPAAVVNLDAGATIDGEVRNVGTELCDSLVEANANAEEGQATGYDWVFLDSVDEARTGLEDGTYYMEMVIPENFSASIASADSSAPQKAELDVHFNPSTNLIAQTVGSSMVTKIRAELNEKVGKSYYENIFLSLSDASSSLEDAVDGSKELQDGLTSAYDGSNTITVNLGTLTDGAAELNSGLVTLTSGAGQVDSGAEQLQSGATALDSGLDSLASGATTLRYGIAALGDGTSSLDNGLIALNSGAAALYSGMQSLSAGAESLDTGLVSLSAGATELSEGLGTLSDGSASLAAGTQQLVDNSGALASGAGEISGGLGQLVGNNDALNGGAAELSGGLSQLQAGSAQYTQTIEGAMEALSADMDVDSAKGAYAAALSDYTMAVVAYGPTSAEAAAALDSLNAAVTRLGEVSGNAGAYQALGTADAGFAQINDGISSAAAGASSLADGVSSYTAGASALAGGAAQLNSGVAAAVSGISSVNSGAASVAGGAASAKDGSDQLASGLESASAGASQVNAGAASALDGSKQLAEGLGSASAGSAALVAGTASALTGVTQLEAGAFSAKDGSGQISAGAATLKYGTASLYSGAQSASSGASQLHSGASQLRDGSGELTSGLSTAADGSATLYDGLKDGQTQIAESSANGSAKSEMMSAPVTANGSNQTGESITQVRNYGTGFAPYFIGLSMWVGCLMITFLIRSLNDRILMSNASSFSAVLSSYLPMAGIAIIQVLILLLLIQFGLGFTVNFPLEYYLFGLLTALTFVAIAQFFRAAFGTAGLVVLVVLLMLQLCTAAGTFPIEAELPIFNVLNPVLPLTYVVKGFRVAMCGLSPGYMAVPFVVMALFMVGFLALSTLLAMKRRKATLDVMYPKIQMAG
ncbi:MAG: YhgE/Pip domain-containing protein [Coriobacteriia bacterium]|nr:YhgE/Pip domain-containing protein [Coriobacteriia bacterium]